VNKDYQYSDSSNSYFISSVVYLLYLIVLHDFDLPLCGEIKITKGYNIISLVSLPVKIFGNRLAFDKVKMKLINYIVQLVLCNYC